MTSCGPHRYTILLGTFLIALSVSVPDLAAAQRIPDKAGLKARVRQFYKAYENRNQQAMLALVLPQILRCTPIENENIFDIWTLEIPFG